jgi:hypothetical protein
VVPALGPHPLKQRVVNFISPFKGTVSRGFLLRDFFS